MVALGPPCVGVCIGDVDFTLFIYFLPGLLPKGNAESGGIWA